MPTQTTDLFLLEDLEDVGIRRAATREHIGQGLRPAVASVGDLSRMLAALGREEDMANCSICAGLRSSKSARASRSERPLDRIHAGEPRMARKCDRQIAVAVLGSDVSEPFHDGGLRAVGRGREIAVGERAATSDRSSGIAVSGAVQIATLAAVVAAGVVASGRHGSDPVKAFDRHTRLCESHGRIAAASP